MLESIKKEGLTRGYLPYYNGDKIFPLHGHQWLTKNKSFKQEWETPNEYTQLKYRRNDYRITIKLPWDDEKLNEWLILCADKKLHLTAQTLNYYGDPENWYLYSGPIKPSHFREIVKNEKAN